MYQSMRLLSFTIALFLCHLSAFAQWTPGPKCQGNPTWLNDTVVATFVESPNGTYIERIDVKNRTSSDSIPAPFYQALALDSLTYFVVTNTHFINKNKLLLCVEYRTKQTGEREHAALYSTEYPFKNIKKVHTFPKAYLTATSNSFHSFTNHLFHFSDSLNGFYFGGPDEQRLCNYILTTQDGGQTWSLLPRELSLPFTPERNGSILSTERSSNSEFPISQIALYGRSVLYSRSQFVYISANVSENWDTRKKLFSWNKDSLYWKSLADLPFDAYRFSASGDSIFLVYEGNGKKTLQVSLNKGTTWSEKQLPNPGHNFYPAALAWVPAGNATDKPFVMVSIQDNSRAHTYVSFDTCRTWKETDNYRHVLFTLKNTRIGFSNRLAGKESHNPKHYQQLYFNYGETRKRWYEDIRDTLSLCENETLNFQANLDGDACYWSSQADGSDTLQLGHQLKVSQVKQNQFYLFSEFHSDTLHIALQKAFPDSLLQSVYRKCVGSAFELTLPLSSDEALSWSNGQKGKTFKSTDTGEYQLYVEPGYYCSGVYRFQVQEHPIYSHLRDTAFCPREFQDSLINFQNNLAKLPWLAPFQTSDLVAYSGFSPIRYTLKDSNHCDANIQWEIYPNCPPSFYVPNAFHPKSSILSNTRFKPQYEDVTNYKIHVYNAWGTKVYEGSHLDLGWDGSYKGEACQQGLYFYTIEYEYWKQAGQKERSYLQGTVMLLR